MLTITDCRPEVQAFACAMEERLRANEHRGDWKTESMTHHLEQIEKHICKLYVSALGGNESGALLKRAANVANVAMFIADVRGALPTQV
jgi:hypothetical protein